MAESTLCYTPAVSVKHGPAHPVPEGSPGPLNLREKRHDCIQLAGFGQGRELAAWLKKMVGVAAAPGAVCTVLDGRARLLGVGPATWLLLSEPGQLNDLPPLANDEMQAIAAVTDYSDGRSVALELRGPAAVEVLSMHLCIDLDETIFPPGTCAATGIHAMQVIVIRETFDVFLVLVQRSFAVSLWNTLLDSAAVYGAIIG